MYLTKWRGFIKPLWKPITFIRFTQAIKDFYKLHLELPQPYLVET